MNRAKILVVFTFLFSFAVCVSAQEQTPKVVWKNLREKYESFYDIKPTIVNVSNKPIYFNCLLGVSDAEYLGIRLLVNESGNDWRWNVWRDGVWNKKKEKRWKKSVEKLEKLRKEGKYIPEGCKLNPNEEFTFDYGKKNWDNIIKGDGIVYEPYKSGKFRFQLPFTWYEDPDFAESPEFWVIPKEETK